MNKITKKLALFLLTWNIIDDAQAIIVCKGFATDDDDFVEVTNNDIHTLETNNNYKEFQIWTTKSNTIHN